MSPAAAAEFDTERRSSVMIRVLGLDDWHALQAARLAALRDSPDAFVATLGDEEARSPEDWKLSIKRSVWAGAWDNGQIVGIACLAAAESTATKRPFIESVWLMPDYRGHDLVRGMLEALEESARADGATHLQLWVLENNGAAVRAYDKLDFRPPVPERVQDSAKPSGIGTFVQEHLMVKCLW
jgi:ribosomal protein S18 acetylase RimI-like enzyme